MRGTIGDFRRLAHRPEIRRHFGRHHRPHPERRAARASRPSARDTTWWSSSRPCRARPTACWGWRGRCPTIPDERELDVVASTGEQVTVGLLALAIQAEGGQATLAARAPGPHPDRQRLRPRPHPGHRLRAPSTRTLAGGKIASSPGFQGVDEDGNITTLGRGGSDTSAVAMAAALKADVCEIYTDVDGVYTADPNVVRDARKIDRISYEEMLELASLGAKVLQIRSVEFGMKYQVPDSRPVELQRQRRDMGRARGQSHGIRRGRPASPPPATRRRSRCRRPRPPGRSGRGASAAGRRPGSSWTSSCRRTCRMGGPT